MTRPPDKKRFSRRGRFNNVGIYPRSIGLGYFAPRVSPGVTESLAPYGVGEIVLANMYTLHDTTAGIKHTGGFLCVRDGVVVLPIWGWGRCGFFWPPGFTCGNLMVYPFGWGDFSDHIIPYDTTADVRPTGGVLRILDGVALSRRTSTLITALGFRSLR